MLNRLSYSDSEFDSLADSKVATGRPDFSGNISLPRHGWYRFKEGFGAEVVQAFVDDHMPRRASGRILDPFLGSGTTAVEGAKLGYDVDGIEVNPFMAFLAKVKTRDYSGVRNLESIAVACLRKKVRNEAFALPNDTTLVERPGISRWLLNRKVARRFEELRTAIDDVRPRVVSDLLLLALMSSVESVANARKDGKCWRYKREWQDRRYDASALDNAFAGQVLRFSNDIAVSPKLNGLTTITCADSRTHVSGYDERPLYDGIITSPPYLNSFDYTDIYRPELLLLKKANNASGLRKLRFSTVRSHVQVAWEPSKALEIPILQKKIKQIRHAGSWCGRIPEMLNAYFVDLDRVVERCSKRLRVGAAAGFVVADSAYCGVVIPVGSILAEVLERRGFSMLNMSVFRETRGNGHHQQRSVERLSEVLVLAKYGRRSRRRKVLM
jgi:DNA modification methylase